MTLTDANVSWFTPPLSLLARSWRMVTRAYHRFRTRNVPVFQNPTDVELEKIEEKCRSLQMPARDLIIATEEFDQFMSEIGFPSDYHGGVSGGVYREKLLEHFVAWKILKLGAGFSTPYVDIAACSSPWAALLRNRGIDAYAIDLYVPTQYAKLGYYRRENATRTSFKPDSIGGASLQCAFEMFLGSQDVDLLKELSRILMKGARAVIAPLYTHTAPCYYQTPEYYGKPFGDPGAEAFIRRDCWGVPASRKYSPETLRHRVWDTAISLGLRPALYVVRNKREIGKDIYLHFVLVLEKTGGKPPVSEVLPSSAEIINGNHREDPVSDPC